MVGSCGAYGGERNVQSLLVDKPVDKTPLVKTSRTCSNVGTAVAQWLRCCATNRKIAGSIPAGVTGILH